jgi:hypothetical protein
VNVNPQLNIDQLSLLVKVSSGHCHRKGLELLSLASRTGGLEGIQLLFVKCEALRKRFRCAINLGLLVLALSWRGVSLSMSGRM